MSALITEIRVMSARTAEIRVMSELALYVNSFGQLLGVIVCGCKYWTQFVVVMKVLGRWESSNVTRPNVSC
jgi:hypothetical protein